jgi:hypothetical protein
VQDFVKLLTDKMKYFLRHKKRISFWSHTKPFIHCQLIAAFSSTADTYSILQGTLTDGRGSYRHDIQNNDTQNNSAQHNGLMCDK